MKNKTPYLVVIISLLIFACSEETIVDPPLNNLSSKYVLVLNEGLFGQNNSSITSYIIDSSKTYQNLYSSANSGGKLGDTANDLDILGDKAYIAVSNSNKIEVINLTTYKSLGFIDLGTNGSPREIALVDSLNGYVTSLNTKKVIKFNPAVKSVLSSIDVGKNPEGIAALGTHVFVANSGFGSDNTVSIIDITNDKVVKTLEVGFNPRVAISDSANFIYVVCSGVFDNVGKGGVYKIDASSLTIVDSVIINSNPGESCLISPSEMLVVNSSGIFMVDLVSMSVGSSPTITPVQVNPNTQVIYSIAYDNSENKIYCGNPKDFVQNGEIVVFNLNGSEISRFNTGLNPGTIVIKK